ncbi:MAG: DivIVA domain-containing protein [Ruminococcaceae bacterium]|nr:DivIVA domain-containing protein [Oscillospiraceae bacterium]
MIPPYELKNKDFSKVMRGYNPSEVDEHFNFIIEKYTELYRENDELERKLKTAYAKLDEIKNEEESIRNAMVNAQRASTKIMTEANDRADIIINTARKSCDRILSDFKKKIQEERAILVGLNKAIAEFKDKLFKIYHTHISYVEEIELLDEDEIIKYSLSDESYTSAVVQNIKQEIMSMTKDATPDLEEKNGEGFVEAELVTQEPVMRLNSVKDTIKELNKRFLDESADSSDSLESDKKDTNEIENEAEKEYGEMLKILGATESVDFKDSENASAGEDEFDKIYHTPDNYGDTIKRKNKN